MFLYDFSNKGYEYIQLIYNFKSPRKHAPSIRTKRLVKSRKKFITLSFAFKSNCLKRSEKMSHDHIGIPKFIEKGFSNNEKVYCYDLLNDKVYQTSIDRLGTKNNYYDKDVEKELLAKKIEYQFSLFYNDFCGTTDLDSMVSILKGNIKLVEQFFSFMFARSRKTLDIVNKNSLSSKELGNLSHSEFLKLNLGIQKNPLEMMGNEYQFYPLINFSSKIFINNSVGFCAIKSKNNNSIIAFFIPLNFRVGIFITNDDNFKNSNSIIIRPDETDKVDFLNNKICITEKEIGNGFIFGDNKELITINIYSI